LKKKKKKRKQRLVRCRRKGCGQCWKARDTCEGKNCFDYRAAGDLKKGTGTLKIKYPVKKGKKVTEISKTRKKGDLIQIEKATFSELI